MTDPVVVPNKPAAIAVAQPAASQLTPLAPAPALTGRPKALSTTYHDPQPHPSAAKDVRVLLVDMSKDASQSYNARGVCAVCGFQTHQMSVDAAYDVIKAHLVAKHDFKAPF